MPRIFRGKSDPPPASIRIPIRQWLKQFEDNMEKSSEIDLYGGEPEMIERAIGDLQIKLAIAETSVSNLRAVWPGGKAAYRVMDRAIAVMRKRGEYAREFFQLVAFSDMPPEASAPRIRVLVARNRKSWGQVAKRMDKAIMLFEELSEIQSDGFWGFNSFGMDTEVVDLKWGAVEFDNLVNKWTPDGVSDNFMMELTKDFIPAVWTLTSWDRTLSGNGRLSAAEDEIEYRDERNGRAVGIAARLGFAIGLQFGTHGKDWLGDIGFIGDTGESLTVLKLVGSGKVMAHACQYLSSLVRTRAVPEKAARELGTEFRDQCKTGMNGSFQIGLVRAQVEKSAGYSP